MDPTTRGAAAGLGVLATAVALGLAAVVGWERGATVAERALWVALTATLVLACHWLPAFAWRASAGLRAIAALVWLAATGATVYGHVSFVMLSQAQAGDARAEAVYVPPVTGDTAVSAQQIAAARERAAVLARLAHTRTVAQHTALMARLAAADVALAEAKREESANDRAVALQDRALAARDAARANPVVDALAGALGWPSSHVSVAVGLLCAAALEGVAIAAWVIAWSRPATGELRDAQPSHGVTAQSRGVATMSGDATAATDATGASRDANERASHAGVARLAPCGGPLPESVNAAVASSVARDGPGVGSAVAVVARPVATGVAASRDALRDPAQQTLVFDVRHASDEDARWRDAAERVRDGLSRGVLRGTVADIRRYLGCSQANALRVRRQLLHDDVLA
ncbi:hypothetical protein [Burkholderia pyrrocinia]|uniref:hypothetical protein n=1 Tax=Burkholderia pyrrocinia TaxID=60550 RepID=UPI001BCB506E|nr:hypothetical protein [Burkholderia pyrrocinia]QVN18967.1 hypothetical protein JYG32_04305 [Burkholderia pyrrocinia]